MNKEVWYQIFKRWVKSYDSIMHLDKTGVLDDEEAIKARDTLLKDIIGTVAGETEDE